MKVSGTERIAVGSRYSCCCHTGIIDLFRVPVKNAELNMYQIWKVLFDPGSRGDEDRMTS